MSNGTNGASAGKVGLTVTTIAAIILTLVYLGAAALLLSHFTWVDNPVGNWERALVIFNGIAAVGFTAVGVLLGTSVQQTNVANARSDAAQAKASEAQIKGAAREVVNAADSDLGGGGFSAAIIRLRTLVER
jgi:hypothetical protein